MARRASLTTMMRKKLSDITNLQTEKAISQDEKPQGENSRTDKDYIDQLLRERATLIRLVTERNKIVELSGAELQKLRISLQKLQLQNLNLAQSNSRMLAELNLGRDKVKNLEHELQCKNALLKAKDLIIQEKAEMTCSLTASQVSKEVEEEALHKDDDGDDGKTYNDNKRRVTRSRSMGPSTTCQKSEHKEKGETKRRCLRRQSATFKPETENLFEIEEAKFPDSHKPDSKMRTSCPTKLILSATTDEKEDNCAPRRSSVGRPMRNAATKVQSYKEVPRNIKLRRAD